MGFQRTLSCDMNLLCSLCCPSSHENADMDCFRGSRKGLFRRNLSENEDVRQGRGSQRFVIYKNGMLVHWLCVEIHRVLADSMACRMEMSPIVGGLVVSSAMSSEGNIGNQG